MRTSYRAFHLVITVSNVLVHTQATAEVFKKLKQSTQFLVNDRVDLNTAEGKLPDADYSMQRYIEIVRERVLFSAERLQVLSEILEGCRQDEYSQWMNQAAKARSRFALYCLQYEALLDAMLCRN